ncbi:hypothetical protein A3B87_00060 [Candidatus Kuenenbacteria bacterium RIFCSPHIGHO2_02_FULL_39_13]|uniref:DegT/DnrJ/EryC1/StrS aminotransferase family protein n=1 Tax=Candidatus Kuenenbacteria bacterium RIFCSPHIGHO2_02_FULL_39_13 TaxID=1798561 RepID=A0A1F6FN20_9BACT|nr:MAG: hypothetical protein A3B87_00060 [Candidatus Kuenenbacteria bacterium RIFCSPHIGHO2_02_FULL_39_13]
MIREVAQPRLRDLFDFHQTSSELFKDIQLTGSGKGALAIILQYLYHKKNIKNKLDEIIVPDWLGYWVYNQIQSFAFPAKRYSERSKAIMVYHQYGFPQDMDKILDFARDKKLIIIEDCAHAIDSSYKGKPLGTFGDFTVYSFSKWFFCFALGGVKSKYDDFPDFARQAISQTPFGAIFFKDLIKLIHEQTGFSDSLLNMSYSLYGQALKPSRQAKKLALAKIESEIKIRQKRYQYFRQQTDNLGICQHLEQDGVTPYVIPIYCPSDKNDYLLKVLADRKIITGLYNFDFNRNLLEPDFKKCIWIPVHSGISDETFSDMTNLVVRTITK